MNNINLGDILRGVINDAENYDWDIEAVLNSFIDNTLSRHLNHNSGSSSNNQNTAVEIHISQERANTTAPPNPSPITTFNSSNTLEDARPNQVNSGISPSQRSDAELFDRSTGTQFTEDSDKRRLVRRINSNIIGKDTIIGTPWGSRRAIYADYTASGRSLLFIEKYILTHVLPFYANTHSENNAFARRTTHFRENSRQLIKKCVNASDEDVLIFTGPGSTSAINKLVEVLQLRDEPIRKRTVVFISTSEHHSNILPWTETGVEWIRVPNTNGGVLDEEFLEQKLAEYSRRDDQSIICSFSAASNVTGILSPVDRISALVHQYKGVIFWDYAAAAPYEKIDMNPSMEASKDAVFISTHKFVGGPGTPGLLIGKKKLFTNGVPVIRGGGTVNFVLRNDVEYHQNIEEREEGGTPDIIGSIRAGYVFQAKDLVGHSFIAKREKELVEKFKREFAASKTLFLLGPTEPDRLAIFSFLIYVPLIGKYLHHNFVCSLLNDLFGIQVRSGCSCAGPYVLDLLNMSDEQANIYTKFISENPAHRTDDEGMEIPHNALMKPGFTRFNLAYFLDDEEVDYIIKAIKFVSIHGWRFLPLYKCNQLDGTWRVHDELGAPHENLPFCLQRVNLTEQPITPLALPHTPDINYTEDMFNTTIIPSIAKENPFDKAIEISNKMAECAYTKINSMLDPPLNVPEKYKDMIWFVIPLRAKMQLFLEYENNRTDRGSSLFRPRYRS